MENVITLFGENEVEVSEETQRAYLLHQEIIFNRDQAAAHLYKMCCQLKEMRDSGLYEKLGFSDFDGYVEKAANIKKRQAYNYIRIIEQLGDDFVQSNAQLGVTKLALLTDVSPMDREEFINENDIESMTVKELEKQIEELKAQTAQLSLFEEENTSLKEEVQNLRDALAEDMSDDEAELIEQVENLKKELKETKEALLNADQLSDEGLEKIRTQIKAEFAVEKKAAVEKAVKKAEKDAEKKIEEAKQKAAEETTEKLKAELDVAEKEKAEALAKAEAFKKQYAINSNTDIKMFEFVFTACQEQLDKLITILGKVKTSDEETYKKLSNAVQALGKQIAEAAQ